MVDAIDGLNEELAEPDQITVSPDTKLFGEGSALDSLSLVSLIADLELALSDKLGRPISLMDDRALSQPESPFTDVRMLTAYIAELIAEST